MDFGKIIVNQLNEKATQNQTNPVQDKSSSNSKMLVTCSNEKIYFAIGTYEECLHSASYVAHSLMYMNNYWRYLR